MFSNYPPTTTARAHPTGEDPFVVYARSLHDYTLHLWTESIRVTQEKKQQHAAAKAERKAAAQRQRHGQVGREVQMQGVDVRDGERESMGGGEARV